MLIKILHLATPSSELPVLWALALDLRKAASIVLASDSSAQLRGLFGDRRNPPASRIHYALARIEDSILMECEAALRERLPSAAMNTYMFDGGIVRIQRGDEGRVAEILAAVGERWGVEFTVGPV